MIRCRFKTESEDYRPVNWPLKHPYWCTGGAIDFSYSVIVSYADDEDEIRRNWPEAYDLNSEVVEDYVFTSRFQKPQWLV